MWSVSRPRPADVLRHLDAQRGLPFTYDAVGATRTEHAPVGFDHDHHRELLGRGAAAFQAACDALRAWAMFPAPLAQIEPAGVAIAPGAVVGVVVLDEPRRFGFAYGTLPGHVERGEERFVVEWLPDDTVWYDLRAFSRPRYWVARLGRPLVRRLQREFARRSLVAMARATQRSRAAR